MWPELTNEKQVLPEVSWPPWSSWSRWRWGASPQSLGPWPAARGTLSYRDRFWNTNIHSWCFHWALAACTGKVLTCSSPNALASAAFPWLPPWQHSQCTSQEYCHPAEQLWVLLPQPHSCLCEPVWNYGQQPWWFSALPPCLHASILLTKGCRIGSYKHPLIR